MSLHHTATSESLKPLMTHNDSGLSSNPPDYDECQETTLTSTPMKGGDHKIFIEGSESSLSETTDSDNSGNSGNSFTMSFILFHSFIEGFFVNHGPTIKKIFIAVLAVAYLVYFGVALYLYATQRSIKSVWPLIRLTCVVLFIIVAHFIYSKFGKDIGKKLKVVHGAVMRKWYILKWVLLLLIYGGILAIIIVTVWEVPSNLVSLGGIVAFIVVLFVLSSSPTRVQWQPVLGGFTLQFYFAVLILRWNVGYSIFNKLGIEIQTFLAYTDVGSQFVFGDKYLDHIFAMKVLPVIVFFSCFISILYYFGVMQVIIGGIAYVMKKMLGTTAAESLCAAGNIFVGQTEAPILIRPYLTLMTKSELHAVMVGGFATIAGGVLAAYVSFGVPAEHLLCASVMNAPCALAVSKLLYPEVETSKLKDVSDIDAEEEDSKPRNFLEAAAAGASASICLVANIAANLIAFLALLAFLNGVLSWFGAFVCYPELSFEKICSYIFMPVAYLMGVDWEDCGVVGELVGIKTFLNEFVAYKELSGFITNRKTCNPDGVMISRRSEIIATYALCGFSNLSSIGIQLGGLGPMAPKRVADLAQLVIRALFGGIVACLLTASMAGLLMEDHSGAMELCLNSTMLNSTMLNSTMLNSTLLDSTVLNSTINAVNSTMAFS